MAKIMRHIATTYLADPRAVEFLLNQPADDMDGRSPWKWVRLANGDLLLGFFPSGDSYSATEQYWGSSDYDKGSEEIRAEDEDTIVDPEPWALYVDGKNTGTRFAEKHPAAVPPIEYRYEPRPNIPTED